MLNHTTLGIFVPKASIPAIQHSQIMDILQLDPAIVVDMDTTKISNTIVESSFMAEFPCTIGDKSYSIIVIGDLSSIDDSSIGERKNPFTRNDTINIIELSRIDITPTMNFSLVRASDQSTIATNSAFWLELRKRIASHHPLSLMHQN